MLDLKKPYIHYSIKTNIFTQVMKKKDLLTLWGEAKEFPGIYKVIIAHTQYAATPFSLSVTGENKFNLLISLPEKSSIAIYDIDSRVRISNLELENIKVCLRENISSPIKCNKKSKYVIGLEL